MPNPLPWVAGAAVAIGAALVVKKARGATQTTTPQAPQPSQPPLTYGEQTRVILPIPSGWRRVTGAEVGALPELRSKAIELQNTSGFKTMAYGTLAPFTASDGKTYATWIEQHYHEPNLSVRPWGYHHGVTLLAKV